MVGIVIVSHSQKLAEGVVEIARIMADKDAPIVAAGGTEDGGLRGWLSSWIWAVPS